ncbi:MAG: cytidine/deoxycytidylate deaminase family protein [Anaerolineales bacterium]
MPDEMNRPTWNEYFLNIAREVAQRSTCERAKVGAVIVKDKRILTTGYNGSPRGLAHCTEVGCLMDNGHCVRTLHAEQNAIIQAALHGVITEGAIIYVTHQPCFNCAKTIINAGISEIVYDREYHDERSLEFLELAGVKLIGINRSE